jgi:hypothetical protein
MKSQDAGFTEISPDATNHVSIVIVLKNFHYISSFIKSLIEDCRKKKGKHSSL